MVASVEELVQVLQATLSPEVATREQAEAYYCKQASDIYDSYVNAPRLYKTNENGERVYLSKEEAAKTIAETRAQKDELCR